MAAEQLRFSEQPEAAPPPLPPPRPPLRKRWAGCLGSLSCFGKQKGGKRIVPATRIPEGSTSANQTNGGQNSHSTALIPSLYAPPSSPASFSNSALQSTAQSPNCFLSANSPGPSSNMYATGPYAHETQLVSPPVFSTYTTEPSTAPLTPPPELAHLTTPSSPDVPFAQFLSSASNFFCPATFAQFYLDQSSFSNSGGRLSVSRESDGYVNAGNGHQSRQNKPFKQDSEELEAYRASFGFSADEIVTTSQYVEITDGLDEPFTITPLSSMKEFPSPNFHKPDPKGVSGQTTQAVSEDEGIFSRMRRSGSVRKHDIGLYSSDAELEYKRGRSLRERKAIFP